MSAPETSQKDVSTSRIKQVFEYLKALNDHRNPAVRQVKDHPWHFWLDHLPDHPDIELRSVRLQDGTDTNEDEESKTPPFLFRVRRPKLTPPPPLPLELHDWLQPQPGREARLHWPWSDKLVFPQRRRLMLTVMTIGVTIAAFT